LARLWPLSRPSPTARPARLVLLLQDLKFGGTQRQTLELARQDKIIGHPLEAEVRVAVSGELADFLADKWETLKAIAIVSELVAVEDAGPGAFRSEEFPELQVTVRAAAGEKCERCWMRSTTVGQDSDHPQICGRCATAVAASR